MQPKSYLLSLLLVFLACGRLAAQDAEVVEEIPFGNMDQWIDRQKARYRTDGYGYFALMLRDSGTIIGQAGLMKSLIKGKECVEIGYILDDAHWHKGYATEAARKCMQYACVDLGLREVYCSIRPANTSSIRVAEAIGMTPCGSHIIIYNGKSMPHLLYKSERE